MTHPNQETIDALTGLLLIDHLKPHIDGPAAYARQTAVYMGRSEHGAPDADDVEAGMRLFLGLRMAWNANPHEVAAKVETMAALQDALRALDYELDLDGTEFEMHSPMAKGALDDLPETALQHLMDSGFVEDADLGILDAVLWHAMAHHVVADALHASHPAQLALIHAKLRYAMITRVYTGSHDRRHDGMAELLVEARSLVVDMASIPDAARTVVISDAIRDTFGVRDEAEGIDAEEIEDGPVIDGHGLTSYALSHASSTLAAVSGGTKGLAWATLSTLHMGSRTGIPASPNLDAIYRLVRETGSVVEEDGGGAGEDLLDAVATVCAAMTLTGRLEPLDIRRNGVLINMAGEYVRQELDPTEDDVATIIETVVIALERMHPEVDDFINHAAASESDEDATIVRLAMASADPSPPPAADVMVVPTAIMIETDEQQTVDSEALRHRIEAFFHVQPDSFRAFGQGDVYWRLALDGHNGYSGTVGALRTISELEGVAKASVVHRSAAGLGVTTMQKGTRPVHRLISHA